MPRPIVFFVLAVAGLLASCASARPPEREPLPFHVAFIPTVGQAGAGAEAGNGASVPVALDARRLDGRMRAELEASGFARVTPLALPESGAAAIEAAGLSGNPEQWDESARMRWWIHAAREAHADMLARGRVAYGPQANGEINDRFWLNLPLFLIGGPLCWFVPDRSYEMTAELDLRLYDLGLLADGLVRSAELGSYQVEYDGRAMKFLERADGAGSYFLSVLVPAGLLARSTDKVSRKLAEDAESELCVALASRVQQDRANLLRPLTLNFSIPPGELVARRQSSGELLVSGAVHFRPEKGAESLLYYTLNDGPVIPFDAPQPLEDGSFDATLVYPIRAQVEAPLDVDHARLRIQQGGGSDRYRTFTVPVQGAVAAR